MLAIYIRRSSDSPNQKSLEFQEELGIACANKNEFLYRIYNEGIISGTNKLEDLPKFKQLLTDLRQQDITGVFVWDTSRMARNELNSQELFNVLEETNTLLYDNGVPADMSDHNTRFFYSMKSSIDALYARQTGAKWKALLRSNAKKGKVQGVIAYGYRSEEQKLVIDEEEAEVVRKIFNWSKNGLGYVSIANELNDLEVPTRYNKYAASKLLDKNKNVKLTYKVDVNRNNDLAQEIVIKDKSKTRWVGGTIKNILNNETYIGKRMYSDIVIDVPPIIDRKLWDAVRNSIETKAKKSGKRVEYKYLLNNLVFCGKCGKRYTGVTLSGHKYYRCVTVNRRAMSCKNRGVRMEILNEFLIDLIYGNLYDKVKESVKNVDNGLRDKIQQEIKTLDIKIDKDNKSLLKIEDDYADETFTKEQFNRQNKRITSRLRENQIKLDNKKVTYSNFIQVDNVLADLEKNIIEPFLDKMEYPFDTSFGNPYEKLLDTMFKAQIGQGRPVEEQQKVMRDYVERIEIKWLKEINVNTIKIRYKLPIEDEIYIIDRFNLYIMEKHKRQLVWANKNPDTQLSERKKLETENFLAAIEI